MDKRGDLSILFVCERNVVQGPMVIHLFSIIHYFIYSICFQMEVLFNSSLDKPKNVKVRANQAKSMY